MGTLKRSKLWYACELTRFLKKTDETSSDGVDNYHITTPEWRDINGNSYTNIGCYTGVWTYPGTEKPLVPNIYISAMHSFDSAVIPHLTNDIISNWTENDYQILDILQSTYTSLFVSSSSSISRKYYITAHNDTSLNISVSCIKFEKKVPVYSSSSPLYSITSGLYASYYLDNPIVINSGETKTIEVIITPDMIYHENMYLKRTTGWYVYEGTRLGSGGSSLQKYQYYEYYTVDQVIRQSTFISSVEINENNLESSSTTPFLYTSTSFLSHGIGIILTDEPIESYDPDTHETIWPYSSSFPYNALQAGPSSAAKVFYRFLSSKCHFDQNEGYIIFKLEIENIPQLSSASDFTLRCLRFIKTGYDTEWPQDTDNPAGYSSTALPFYSTYYLPQPIVIPLNEKRIVEIKISPKGILVS